MSAREKLKTIIDALPDDRLESALRVLESIQPSAPPDPVVEMLLNAPEDDEPLSDEEREALALARRDKAYR